MLELFHDINVIIKYFLMMLKSKLRQLISYYPVISLEEQEKRIVLHLKKRRELNEIGDLPEKPRIFAAVKNINWEKAALVDSWEDLADVHHYDWEDQFNQYASDWFENGRLKFQDTLYDQVVKANEEQKVDIFFSYLSGRWISKDIVERIKNLGIITINYDYDDSLKFWNQKVKGVYTGSAEIAPAYDICISAQSEKNIVKYLDINANPIFLPSGGNKEVFAKVEPPSQKGINVSFIGQNYGERGKLISKLKDQGIDIYTRGKGWEEGPVSINEMLEIYSNSLLTLGFGYIAQTKLTGLKGRDFEVPMTGCAYLTTYNPELAKYFDPDKEILFYKNEKDLIEKIRYYTNNPEEAIKIGLAGRKRSLENHCWPNRWKKVLELCR